MSEALWEGIPRHDVPWYPTVNDETCIGCQDCITTCPGDVYDWDDATNQPIVARPYNCVVYCMGCAKACPEGAISFPEKEEIVELVKQLRVKFGA